MYHSGYIVDPNELSKSITHKELGRKRGVKNDRKMYNKPIKPGKRG
jgi:hypothetical protein